MVRSGSRPGQVVSSGKHTASAKLTNGKKSAHLRKVSRFQADSGYRIHSDSESQTESVRGLDGCASLLQNILRNEDSGSETAYSDNRQNSRPLEGKRHGSKKKGHEKHTVPSLVKKEILSSDYKKQIPDETSAGSERDSSDIPQNWSLQDHYRMYSPIIYQALCEHVQTQMSLMNHSSSKNSTNGTPAASCHTVFCSDSQATPHSSESVSTSTPVQLPQQPPCPQMVHSEVQTDDDNHFAPQHKTVSVNSTDILRNSFHNLGVHCSLPHTDKAALPASQQLSLANGILPQEVSKEPDLLKCFQTHVNLWHSYLDSRARQSPTSLQPACMVADEEKCVQEQVGKVTSEEKDFRMHVQDPRIKGVQKAKNGNQSAEKVRTIKYLLGELKALVAEQVDSELQRLIAELEACVSLLPATSGSANIQVEIALAMQPLRSENAQLRRQLRILNQQLREQGKTKKTSGSQECNLELFSLQSLNKSLQNQLQESLKNQELLQSKNEELLKVIENQKEENKKFADIFKEKDQTILENKQQFDIETTRIKIELEEALVSVESCRFKLEAAEKENQILGITLRQRDAEVTRLRDLTRTLQKSMAKLLADLSVDAACRGPGNGLTKSLLDVHGRQPLHDPVPARVSVLSYLSKLEAEPLSPTLQGDRAGRSEGAPPPRGPQPGDPGRSEEVSAAAVVPALSLGDSDGESKTASVAGEGSPDHTVYLPFARSACRELFPEAKRPAAPGCRGPVSDREREPPAPPAARPLSGQAEDAPDRPSRAAEVEDQQLLRRIEEALGRVPAAARGPPEPGRSRSVPAKGSAVSDGSFWNSDWTSDWSASSFSTFTSRDERDFRSGLAALDADIARLQAALGSGLLEK